MLSKFFPGAFIKSIYDINPASLKAAGIKGIILDLDNTIIARNASTVDKDLKHWVGRLKQEGIKACILSNNWKLRVSSIASQLNIPLVARAAKPYRGAFKRAMSVLGTSKGETVVVGDQIFTDILGGNLAGLKTILVVPMSNSEAIHTKLLRHFERWILKRWNERATIE